MPALRGGPSFGFAFLSAVHEDSGGWGRGVPGQAPTRGGGRAQRSPHRAHPRGGGGLPPRHLRA
eukprot:6281852-Pyramimonas_sp.AAC.1